MRATETVQLILVTLAIATTVSLLILLIDESVLFMIKTIIKTEMFKLFGPSFPNIWGVKIW